MTTRQANLHNVLLRMLGREEFAMPEDSLLYAVAYRPVRREETNQIDVWPETPTLGGSLPVLPLAASRLSRRASGLGGGVSRCVPAQPVLRSCTRMAGLVAFCTLG
jgi:hypothetical protein